MKRFLLLLLSVLALLPACQRDNYFEELGKPEPLPQKALRADGDKIHGQISFRGEFPGKVAALYDALAHRANEVLSSELVLESAMVVIGNAFDGFLSEAGDMPADSLIETAYHNGVILAFTFPDYEKISRWCDRKGIVFPGIPAEGGDRLLLCAFSNRGWLYDMDDPRYRMDAGAAADFNAWLNPFVAWVNAHIAAGTATSPYVIGCGEDLVFEQNLACQKYDHTYFLALSDTVKALSQMTCRFTSWPVTGAERDWFLCQAELDINNAPLFRGTGVSESGSYRTKYSAYEMRQAGFRFDLAAGTQNVDGFEQGPQPQTAAAGEALSPDFDWTLPESGIFTEGPVTARRSSALTAAVSPRHYDSAGTCLFEDLGVENVSADGVVSYRFTVPSPLLGYMHRTEIHPSEARICCEGRDDLRASWVWRCPRWDYERILNVSAFAAYVSMAFRSDVVGAGQWKDHCDAQGKALRKIRLLSPGRVLTGQLQLVNDFDDGASCTAMRLWAEGKDPKKDIPDYDALMSVVAPGDRFVRNVEAGRYLLQFYKQSADGEGMWLKEATVDITAAQAAVLSAAAL